VLAHSVSSSFLRSFLVKHPFKGGHKSKYDADIRRCFVLLCSYSISHKARNADIPGFHRPYITDMEFMINDEMRKARVPFGEYEDFFHMTVDDALQRAEHLRNIPHLCKINVVGFRLVAIADAYTTLMRAAEKK